MLTSRRNGEGKGKRCSPHTCNISCGNSSPGPPHEQSHPSQALAWWAQHILNSEEHIFCKCIKESTRDSEAQFQPFGQIQAWGHRGSAWPERRTWNSRDIPVIIINTMWLVGFIHNEGCPFQGFVAHHTCETLRMVGITSSPQHPVCDCLLTHTAFL